MEGEEPKPPDVRSIAWLDGWCPSTDSQAKGDKSYSASDRAPNKRVKSQFQCSAYRVATSHFPLVMFPKVSVVFRYKTESDIISRIGKPPKSDGRTRWHRAAPYTLSVGNGRKIPSELTHWPPRAE
jgi:hypothetical protein